MRLRGVVFEQFVSFERAEVNFCDENGVPLDVVLFVGEAGTGKSALLRGISALLSEAAGGEEELEPEDVRRNAGVPCRCRVVFDDLMEGARVVVTLEKELPRPASTSGLRASPPEGFDKWRRAIEQEATPRAAFSVTRSGTTNADPEPNDAPAGPATTKDGAADDDDGDPLFAWFGTLRGTPKWDTAIAALDRVLWPCRFDHLSRDGDVVFATASGFATSSELGDGFESVLVMALDLLHLTLDRSAQEELVYVIDDIDAHLHPRWQARLIGDLRRAFPRVQLIATTHSPLVVASVEPQQVFRLQRATGTERQPTAISRASDRIKRDDIVSDVMELAFGTPELPGPKWVHSPNLAMRRDLMRALEADLTRGSVVYVLPEPVHVKDVRNAFGEPVLPTADGAHGHLFFVDFHPGTSWGHPCEYIFRTRDGRLTRQRAIWPPTALERFIPMGRG